MSIFNKKSHIDCICFEDVLQISFKNNINNYPQIFLLKFLTKKWIRSLLCLRFGPIRESFRVWLLLLFYESIHCTVLTFRDMCMLNKRVATTTGYVTAAHVHVARAECTHERAKKKRKRERKNGPLRLLELRDRSGSIGIFDIP